MEIICSKCDGKGVVEATTQKDFLYALAATSPHDTIRVSDAVTFMIESRLSRQTRRSLYTHLYHTLENDEGWKWAGPGTFRLLEWK